MLTRAKAARIVTTLDSIALTQILAKNGNTPPHEIQESIIDLICLIRRDVATSYGLMIDPRRCVDPNVLCDVLTPQETAELMMEEMEDDLG